VQYLHTQVIGSYLLGRKLFHKDRARVQAYKSVIDNKRLSSRNRPPYCTGNSYARLGIANCNCTQFLSITKSCVHM